MKTSKMLAIAIALLTDLNPTSTPEQIERMAKFGFAISQSPIEYLDTLYEQAGICR